MTVRDTDPLTEELLDDLFAPQPIGDPIPDSVFNRIIQPLDDVEKSGLIQPTIDLFQALLDIKRKYGATPAAFNLSRQTLADIADRHAATDEHGVTVGGRLGRARLIVDAANKRVQDYMDRQDIEAPSGLQLWDRIQERIRIIQDALGMTAEDWGSYTGQLRHRINTPADLAKVIDLPPKAIQDVARVTKTYRMRLTPYYASLIQPGRLNDPVLIQSVPTREMVDNLGEEIPPVAADHSPARLVDQFYPRVVTIKATNMCAMYCTHCLRIAHIGKKDRVYPRAAYGEALDYIRRNTLIRDVLITGGDAFALPNDMIR